MVQISPAIEIEDLIKDSEFDINDWYGYIYLTVDTKTGRKYVGKKNFFHSQYKKLGKKELASIPVTRGKRPTKKLIIKESDWKIYYGSANEIKSSSKDHYKRYLLKLCKSSKQLTYFELKYQFIHGVLENDGWINDNIQGRFFRKDLV
jgi:hypothetical protein